MSISLYTPPDNPDDEPARNRAAIESGLMAHRASEILERLVLRAATTFGTSMAAVTLIHHERQIVLAAVGVPSGETARSTSFCGHAILNPHTVMWVQDAQADERFAGNPLVLGEPHIRFYAGAPLLTEEGHAIGSLCVFDRHPRGEAKAAEAEALKELAAAVMAATHAPGASQSGPAKLDQAASPSTAPPPLE